MENYARHLLAFLHWCVAEGVLEHDPTERVRIPKAEKKHLRVFPDEESPRPARSLRPAQPSIGVRPDVRHCATC